MINNNCNRRKTRKDDGELLNISFIIKPLFQLTIYILIQYV